MARRLRTLIQYLFPWQHAGLIGQFVRREVDARYRQSWLGVLWVLLTPLLTLTVYTLVLRMVFKLRWGAGGMESDLDFALRLYAGLAVFNYFADCVSRAPRLVLDQPYLVKKVIFPLEIMAWVNALSALVHLGIALLLMLVLSAWEYGRLPLTALAIPLVWLPMLPLCVGLGWLLSGIGTYVRDVGQVIGMAISLLLFLSPIFFPVDALPAVVQPWMFLNPLALTITQSREVLFDGVWPQWHMLAMQFIACTAIAAGAAAFFNATRKGFADVV